MINLRDLFSNAKNLDTCTVETCRRQQPNCVRSVVPTLLPGESCADFIQYTPNTDMVKDHEDPRVKATLRLMEENPNLSVCAKWHLIPTVGLVQSSTQPDVTQ